MNARRVAVTGAGAVSPFGWGVGAFWDGLAAGRSAIRDFSRFDHSRYRTHIAGEVPVAGEPTSELSSRRLTLADRFALAAASEALAGAGLPAVRSALAATEAGVFFGSSTGGTVETENFFEGLTQSGRRRARIGLLVAQEPNGPADAVARAFGAAGPVTTISSACASATLAFGLALDALRRGEIDLGLAGGADALCRLTYAGFNSLRAVDAISCRPFRAEREGMSIGEGAAVLVLESEAAARRRGGRILGYLRGTGASCDAHHMTAPEPSGEGVARAIRAALEDAEVRADEIDFVNAHGTGTPLNDAAEAHALAIVFGERVRDLPVTSTKGAVGHFLGAAGAIEAVATLLCLGHREVHPTPGEGTVDPTMAIDLVVGSPRAVPHARFALSTNFAFGGSNAAAVFERGDDA